MSVSSLAAWHSTERRDGVRGAVLPSEAEIDERTLVSCSRNGDVAAFGKLYALHEQAIYRYAYRLLEDADEADDIRQETFVRAFQSLSRFRGDAAFRTYLLSISGNLCRDRQRQRQRRPEQGYGLEAPESARANAGATMDAFAQKDPLLRLEQAARAETVWKAMRQLRSAEREILILRHVEGLDLDEVAQIVGCSRVSAPVRLFRARCRFKQLYLSLLQEEGEI